jgi:hypothetical protein
MITTLHPLVPAELPALQFEPDRALQVTGGRDDAVRVQCTVADLPALTSTANGVRLYVEVDAAGLAPGTTVDVAALTASGVAELALIGDSPVGVTTTVAVLRDAMEHGLPIRWHGSLAHGLGEAAELVHLQPPVDAPSDWLDRHQYAQLYWRKGPNFVSVVDKRHETQTRYVLDERDLLAVFDALAVPVRPESMPAAWHEPLHELLDAHLAMQVDGWVTRLPYRLRRWPMPSEGV